MNLVQKLPMGLSLACIVMMSSCSKENALTPEHKMGSLNEHSDTRKADVVIALPQFPSTIGVTGIDIYPKGWKRELYPGTPPVAEFPTGVSNRTHAFGNFGVAYQWVKPLPEIPSAPDANSFITITTKSSEFDATKRADVTAEIKYLEVGQQYSIDFYVSSTSVGGRKAGYARKVIARIGYPSTPKDIDLVGKKAEWVKESIVFTALAWKTTFYFSAASEHDHFAYAHIFVDKNSIKKVL
jgi:hypothetical protein